MNRVIGDFAITNNTGSKIDFLKVEPRVISNGKYISLNPKEEVMCKVNMTGIAQADGSIGFHFSKMEKPK